MRCPSIKGPRVGHCKKWPCFTAIVRQGCAVSLSGMEFEFLARSVVMFMALLLNAVYVDSHDHACAHAGHLLSEPRTHTPYQV